MCIRKLEETSRHQAYHYRGGNIRTRANLLAELQQCVPPFITAATEPRRRSKMT
jgi:hypothetical protein